MMEWAHWIASWLPTAFLFFYSFMITVLYIMYLGKYHDWRMKAEMLSSHVERLKLKIKNLERKNAA